MTTLVLIARVALALVFLVSAIAKLRDRQASRLAVQDFGVPTPLVGVVAAVLPFAELVSAGLLLVADPGATAGAVLAGLMLLAFTTAIVVNLLRGNRVDCHCFGQIGAGSIGWPTVARNGVLLLLVAIVLAGASSLGSVPAAVADYTAGELAFGLVVLVLTGAIGALGLVVKTLMGRYGSVLLRLEALEAATGLAAPTPAPTFALPDLDGRVVALDDVLALQKPVLVAFISPSCSLCEQLLPDIEAWQQDEDHTLSVLVLSSGTAQANLDKLGGRAVQVLLHDGEVAKAYDMQGTPAAYLLGTDGLLAAPTAYGVDAVRELHDRTVATMTGRDQLPVHQVGPRPVSPGDPVPDVTVETEDGQSWPLEDLVGDEAVLLFWRSTCGYCAGILDEVVALEPRARILLVTGTGLDELRADGLTSVVVRESGGALTSALQVPGTPSAVRVRGGAVDSTVAIGGPQVLALLRASSAVKAEA